MAKKEHIAIKTLKICGNYDFITDYYEALDKSQYMTATKDQLEWLGEKNFGVMVISKVNGYQNVFGKDD